MDYKHKFEVLRSMPKPIDDVQARHDAFYRENGPCCAGCDHWAWFNSRTGECRKAAPVSGAERGGMLGITGVSFTLGAGHPLTKREHRCGDFLDTYNWDLQEAADDP